MVRVVRLERTVSWSQTRRDTNFAIPGYSISAIIPRRGEKIKDFSVCGHLCGQSRFYAVFGNRGKSCKRRRRKALRRSALTCPGYNHGTPKSSAIPTSLHPDTRLFYQTSPTDASKSWQRVGHRPTLCRMFSYVRRPFVISFSTRPADPA